MEMATSSPVYNVYRQKFVCFDKSAAHVKNHVRSRLMPKFQQVPNFVSSVNLCFLSGPKIVVMITILLVLFNLTVHQEAV